MAFPTTGIIDNFDRANANTLGANWSLLAVATDQVGIESNAAACVTNSYVGSYRNTSTYGPDCEAYSPRTEASETGNYYGVWLRVVDPGTGTPDGYQTGYSSNDLTLTRNDNGVGTQLGSTYVSDFITACGIEAIGSAIKVYSLESGVWTSRISVTDATYGAAGSLALDIFDPGAQELLPTEFGGGTIAGAAVAVPRHPAHDHGSVTIF